MAEPPSFPFRLPSTVLVQVNSRFSAMKFVFRIALALLCAASLSSTGFADGGDGDASGAVTGSGGGGGGGGGGGDYDYFGFNFESQLFLNEMGSLGASNVLGNDIWGWTHQPSGREFALMGMTNQTAFVEVTNSKTPVYLGSLASTTGNRAWRDMKVYNDQAYIVSDSNGAHGVQVFDLTQLLSASPSTDPDNPNQFSTVGIYTGINSAHNIAINEDSGYAYVVGSRPSFSGGLHVLDLNGGTGGAMPTLVGGFSADGYTHDTQVVNYVGPDADYANQEIAFNSNEDTLTIVNVTDKSDMTQISRTGYSGSQYSHQGWLSEDQQFFFMNDELDESRSDELIATRTHVWDVTDLDNPLYVGFHEGTQSTIDHNLYIKDDLMFQANYSSGLRLLRINDAATLDFEEIAYFDTHPDDNAVNFDGAWSVYPYFESGTIIVSDRQRGLFVLTSVPEPNAMLILGCTALAMVSRRRRRQF